MENQNHVWQANLPECLLFHCLEDSGFESIATYKKVIKVRKNKLVKWVNHDNKRKKCKTAERGLFIAGRLRHMERMRHQRWLWIYCANHKISLLMAHINGLEHNLITCKIFIQSNHASGPKSPRFLHIRSNDASGPKTEVVVTYTGRSAG
jgi:hypothetical protein